MEWIGKDLSNAERAAYYQSFLRKAAGVRNDPSEFHQPPFMDLWKSQQQDPALLNMSPNFIPGPRPPLFAPMQGLPPPYGYQVPPQQLGEMSQDFARMHTWAPGPRSPVPTFQHDNQARMLNAGLGHHPSLPTSKDYLAMARHMEQLERMAMQRAVVAARYQQEANKVGAGVPKNEPVYDWLEGKPINESFRPSIESRFIATQMRSAPQSLDVQQALSRLMAESQTPFDRLNSSPLARQTIKSSSSSSLQSPPSDSPMGLDNHWVPILGILQDIFDVAVGGTKLARGIIPHLKPETLDDAAMLFAIRHRLSNLFGHRRGNRMRLLSAFKDKGDTRRAGWLFGCVVRFAEGNFLDAVDLVSLTPKLRKDDFLDGQVQTSWLEGRFLFANRPASQNSPDAEFIVNEKLRQLLELLLQSLIDMNQSSSAAVADLCRALPKITALHPFWSDIIHAGSVLSFLFTFGRELDLEYIAKVYDHVNGENHTASESIEFYVVNRVEQSVKETYDMEVVSMQLEKEPLLEMLLRCKCPGLSKDDVPQLESWESENRERINEMQEEDRVVFILSNALKRHVKLLKASVKSPTTDWTHFGESYGGQPIHIFQFKRRHGLLVQSDAMSEHVPQPSNEKRTRVSYSKASKVVKRLRLEQGIVSAKEEPQ